MSDLILREWERKAKAGDKDAPQEILKIRARNGEIEIQEFNGVVYEIRNWGAGYRTDVYGNNRACNCPDLKKVIGMFCVCYGKAWCPNHKTLRCVGGHD